VSAVAAEAPEDTASLVTLHASIAELLADRGEWRQAYEHLRHALELMSTEQATPPPRIPEQFREEVDRRAASTPRPASRPSGTR
jgi:two-component system cell cycle response regulator